MLQEEDVLDEALAPPWVRNKADSQHHCRPPDDEPVVKGGSPQRGRTLVHSVRPFELLNRWQFLDVVVSLEEDPVDLLFPGLATVVDRGAEADAWVAFGVVVIAPPELEGRSVGDLGWHQALDGQALIDHFQVGGGVEHAVDVAHGASLDHVDSFGSTPASFGGSHLVVGSAQDFQLALLQALDPRFPLVTTRLAIAMPSGVGAVVYDVEAEGDHCYQDEARKDFASYDCCLFHTAPPCIVGLNV